MKTCNYLSESIVLITPAVGEPYKAKLVTEYGRNATGGLIVVSTRYVDAKNEVITLGATDAVEIKSSGQPLSAQSNCIVSTEQNVCADGLIFRLVTEYGYSDTGLIVVSTRYVDSKNEVQAIPVDAEITYGSCAASEDGCKGAHYETLTLVAGTAQTITHEFNLTVFTKIGYSVISADGTVSGQWPTGVRFINHTASTVDIIADGINGVVDVVLTNAECLELISKGDAGAEDELQAQIDALAQDAFDDAPTPGTGDLQTQIDELSLDSFE